MADNQIQSIQGTQDLLPEQWGYWRRLYGAASRLFERAGYGQLRTPVLEDARLFIKGTGETTDVVEKEMYTIPAGEGESVALRPEGTPGVARSYLEHSLHKQVTFQKFYYIGPMFRHEKPQKARLRQFHHAGVEAIGSGSPLLDAETILLAEAVFREIGLSGYEVVVNSIGCEECRADYRQQVREMLGDRVEDLCEDCRRRLDRNVFRVLDCKNEQCSAITAELPPVTEFLDDDCATHYDAVKGALWSNGLEFTEDPKLVRGLDYYTRTVYEFIHPGLGARNAICGGGRYDNLVELLGGPSLPCVGFAIGAEATILAMESELGPAGDASPRPDVYVVCFDDEARAPCFDLVQRLRGAGIGAEMDYEDRSAKSQMRTADRLGAKLCFLIGGRELEQDQVLIKDMAEGNQWNAPWEDAAAEVKKCLADGE